jgi:hypothetical protein
MKTTNLILGGLKMKKKSLTKYSSLYPKNTDKIIIPFDFTSMAIPKKYCKKYKNLYHKLKEYDNIYVHSLSGSCHFFVNLFEMYPDLKPKVKTQIFDSPSHIDGLLPYAKKQYNIPECISELFRKTLFKDCIYTSQRFVREPIIEGIPTGIIFSEKDKFAKIESIYELIDKWENNTELKILKTESEHLKSIKDNRIEYKKFIEEVIN